MNIEERILKLEENHKILIDRVAETFEQFSNQIVVMNRALARGQGAEVKKPTDKQIIRRMEEKGLFWQDAITELTEEMNNV